ncbi:2OG-Fe(II) oxygenase [Shewanella glacialipiscicola]|uniref:Prolyl 4-hydroxylase subunit alpha n=3 Tax=Shewanella glacialipiscicola TaxID=614069 RepID=A0ABQ6J589_9GAMM|nr:2OG-Fe(II) oxygenase [Shewanella glacialipiscicola]MCL1084646.1 2OG-Fe(II) oxygenase [Shewanella glacialipiscicola]GMA82414.1 prolyl 4-hydroxylase subunit alpha [Shewanella glacialipiscicola]
MDFIEVYPNALPDELCDRLILAFDEHSGVVDGQTGNGIDPEKKISRDLTLDNFADLLPLKNELLGHTLVGAVDYFTQYSMALMGAVAVSVNDEQGQLTTLTPANFAALGVPRVDGLVRYLYRSGSINIQKYQQNKGGYPHWHSEQFPQNGHNEALHRVVLYMFYLNDVEEGGETEFYYQQRKISPKKGTMVIAPAGFTHSHRGNRPVSGDKYIVTSWLMFNRAEKLYAILA